MIKTCHLKLVKCLCVMGWSRSQGPKRNIIFYDTASSLSLTPGSISLLCIGDVIFAVLARDLWPNLNIKVSSYQYKKSHRRNKMVVGENLLFPVQSHLGDTMCSYVIQRYRYQMWFNSQYSLWITGLSHRSPLMSWLSDDKRTHVTKLHIVDMFICVISYSKSICLSLKASLCKVRQSSLFWSYQYEHQHTLTKLTITIREAITKSYEICMTGISRVTARRVLFYQNTPNCPAARCWYNNKNFEMELIIHWECSYTYRILINANIQQYTFHPNEYAVEFSVLMDDDIS